MGTYSDIRQEFWRSHFETALPMGPYLAAGKENHRVKWETMTESITLSDEQRLRAATFVRTMPVLCLSGIWCGDCVRQGPILQEIANASPGLDLRLVERTDNDTLSEELRINGALKVPVVVLLSEDFFEVARIGDRMLSTYRKKAQRDLGPTCEVGLVPPTAKELAVEIDEWMDDIERAQWILRLSPLLRQRYGD